MSSSPEEPRGHRVAEYEEWVKEQQIPIHKGYFVSDFKTIEVGPWDQRETNGCFVQLAGQEGWTQICVQEIPPGRTSRPFKMAVDELIYVADGRGVTTLWADGEKKLTLNGTSSVSSLCLETFGTNYQICRGQNPAGSFIIVIFQWPYRRSEIERSSLIAR